MIYVVILLLAICHWQHKQRGEWSLWIFFISLISALSLLVFGLIFQKIKWIEVVVSVLFMFFWFVLIKIFNLTTYHKYFKKYVVLLVIYGLLIPFILYLIGAFNYSLLYVILFIVILNSQKEKMKNSISKFSKAGKVCEEYKIEEYKDFSDLLVDSLILTQHYHYLSSRVFVISFMISSGIIFILNKL